MATPITPSILTLSINSNAVTNWTERNCIDQTVPGRARTTVILDQAAPAKTGEPQLDRARERVPITLLPLDVGGYSTERQAPGREGGQN